MDTFQRGEVCSPSEVYGFIQHVMEYNLHADEHNLEKLVGCVWGHAGISKTAIIKQLETVGVQLGDKRVFPKVKHVALAQIEEAGDITGLPELRKRKVGTRKVVDEKGVEHEEDVWESFTGYAPPSWWPRKDEGHVVLLFDDFNRADPRILKAIMQLLQDYRSNVCDLPPLVSIMLTGNPSDEGDYMVNEIDKAILTRMCHITMKFDKKDWAIWAKGAGIDERVISFVLAYPEACNGEDSARTNPRSIVQFARLVAPIQDLKEHSKIVSRLAKACMDDVTADAFMKFAVGDYKLLVDPYDLLTHYDAAIKRIEGLRKGSDGQPREDLIGIINDRLFVYMMQDKLKLTDNQRKNFIEYIKRSDIMPRDMIIALLRRLRLETQLKGASYEEFIIALLNEGGDELADILTDAM